MGDALGRLRREAPDGHTPCVRISARLRSLVRSLLPASVVLVGACGAPERGLTPRGPAAPPAPAAAPATPPAEPPAEAAPSDRFADLRGGALARNSGPPRFRPTNLGGRPSARRVEPRAEAGPGGDSNTPANTPANAPAEAPSTEQPVAGVGGASQPAEAIAAAAGPAAVEASRVGTVAASATLARTGAAPWRRGAPTPVALLEVELPVGRQVLVRATLPVPAGFDLGVTADSDTSLALEAPDGTSVPCQLEVVTRDAAGAPLVVELIAPVLAPSSTARAGGAEAGHARLTLAVRHGSFRFPAHLGGASAAVASATGAGGLDAEVAAWLGAGPCTLRARDVFGNLYVGDLLRPIRGEVLTQGPYLTRIDAAAVMRPVDEPGRPLDAATALPHLLGLHGHFTLVAGDPRVALDLRAHNGLTSGAAADSADDSPVGAVWFDQLDLELPALWTCEDRFPDAAFGAERVEDGVARRALVTALPRRHLHFMPPGAQLQRRLVLRPRDTLAGHPTCEAIGFPSEGDALWSWHSDATAAFGPQRVALPTWRALVGARPEALTSLRATLADRRTALLELARRGSGDGVSVHGSALGWCHPWSRAELAALGQAELPLVAGHLAVAARSAPELERLTLAHQMNVSRHPVAMWLADGRPAGLDAWRDAAGRVGFDLDTSSGRQAPELTLPAAGGTAPALHFAEVARQMRRPWYDQGTPFTRPGTTPTASDAVLAWQPHPGRALARFTKPAEALVWLTNDALARADLELEAERFRLMTHDAAAVDAGDAAGAPPATQRTLTQLTAAAAARPHAGLPLDRTHAFGLDVFAAVYATADDGWRAKARPWLTALVDTWLAGTMPNGLVTRQHAEGLLLGRYDGAYAVDALLLLHAQRALVGSTLIGADGPRADALVGAFFRGVEYLFEGAPFQRVPDRWTDGPSLGGPASQFAVAPRGLDGGPSSEPPYCDTARWGPDHLPRDGRTPDAVEATYTFEVLTYADDWAHTFGRPDAGRWFARTLDLWLGLTSHEQVVQRLRRREGGEVDAGAGEHAAYLGRAERAGASR